MGLTSGEERTAISDALIIAGRIVADYLRALHLYTEMLLHEVDGG